MVLESDSYSDLWNAYILIPVCSHLIFDFLVLSENNIGSNVKDWCRVLIPRTTQEKIEVRLCAKICGHSPV